MKPIICKEIRAFIKLKNDSIILVEGTGDGCHPLTCILCADQEIVMILRDYGFYYLKISDTEYIIFPRFDSEMYSLELPYFDEYGNYLSMRTCRIHSKESTDALKECYNYVINNKEEVKKNFYLQSFEKAFSLYSLDGGISSLIPSKRVILSDLYSLDHYVIIPLHHVWKFKDNSTYEQDFILFICRNKITSNCLAITLLPSIANTVSKAELSKTIIDNFGTSIEEIVFLPAK